MCPSLRTFCPTTGAKRHSSQACAAPARDVGGPYFGGTGYAGQLWTAGRRMIVEGGRAVNERTQAVYNALCAFIEEEGYRPTLQEIANRVDGITGDAGIIYHINILARTGVIRKTGFIRCWEPVGEEEK